MADNIKYLNSSHNIILYKDAFVVYLKLIKEKLKELKLSEDIIMLSDGDKINTDRAPLIVLKRTGSPQPPTIALMNEKLHQMDGKKMVYTSFQMMINMAINCYGTTYVEAERLSSAVVETLYTSSIKKINLISEGKIVGHEVINWGEVGLISQDTKLFASRIDMRITILAHGTTNIESSQKQGDNK